MNITAKKNCLNAEEQLGVICMTLKVFLEEIPTEDILHITRCKDCKYYKEGFCYNRQWFDDDSETNVKETDFCSYGTPQNDEVRE